MSFFEKLRAWARRLKRDSVTLWFAYRHPDTPLLAKAVSLLVVVYALSPIDPVPDFIPVLGYLDEVIVLPCLIWFAIKLLPTAVLADSRVKCDEWMEIEGRKPRSNWGIVLVLGIWMLAGWALWVWAIAPLLK